MATIKRRATSGAIAGTGAFASTMVAVYQTAHEAGLEVHLKDALKVSGGVGLAAGILWALTPAATKTPEEVIEHTKEKTYPSLRLLIRRTVAGEAIAGPRVSTVSRSRVDTGFEDVDPVSDEEYADMLDEEMLARDELLDDPFYEGPSSIFDRL